MAARTRTAYTAGGIAAFTCLGLSALAAPAGHRRRTATDADGGKTIVVLHVRGLLPNREYGAHAHKFACGATDRLVAGGHFQYVPDPVQPSTDPADRRVLTNRSAFTRKERQWRLW